MYASSFISIFQTLHTSLLWLNDWERQKLQGHITNDQFLTVATAHSLRVTINSTMDLCNDLLKVHGFKYVLTVKMNQDRLEVITYVIKK